MFVFHITILLTIIYRMHGRTLLFLVYLRNKIHMLHVITHQEFLQKKHQTSYIVAPTKPFFQHLFYRVLPIDTNKIPHNMKTWYQLHPTYHP